jgi:hypothetical protein
LRLCGLWATRSVVHSDPQSARPVETMSINCTAHSRMDLDIDAAITWLMSASRPPSGSLCHPPIIHPLGRPHVIRCDRTGSGLAPFGDRLPLVNRLTQAVGEKLGSKKAPPPRRPGPNASSEIPRYCRPENIETRDQQFAMDAGRPPEHVVSCHTADQVANLRVDSRPPSLPDAPKPWQEALLSAPVQDSFQQGPAPRAIAANIEKGRPRAIDPTDRTADVLTLSAVGSPLDGGGPRIPKQARRAPEPDVGSLRAIAKPRAPPRFDRFSNAP